MTEQTHGAGTICLRNDAEIHSRGSTEGRGIDNAVKIEGITHAEMVGITKGCSMQGIEAAQAREGDARRAQNRASRPESTVVLGRK